MLTKLCKVKLYIILFPDLLAKAYLAKPLTAFGKTFIRRSDI